MSPQRLLQSQPWLPLALICWSNNPIRRDCSCTQLKPCWLHRHHSPLWHFWKRQCIVTMCHEKFMLPCSEFTMHAVCFLIEVATIYVEQGMFHKLMTTVDACIPYIKHVHWLTDIEHYLWKDICPIHSSSDLCIIPNLYMARPRMYHVQLYWTHIEGPTLIGEGNYIT